MYVCLCFRCIYVYVPVYVCIFVVFLCEDNTYILYEFSDDEQYNELFLYEYLVSICTKMPGNGSDGPPACISINLISTLTGQKGHIQDNN